jgi:hypothetical protein
VAAGAAKARDELAIITQVMQDKKTTDVALTIALAELERTESFAHRRRG